MTADEKRDLVKIFKEVYDDEGIEGFKKLFEILRRDNNPCGMRIANELLYKIETCTSDCFENIDYKKYCECNCNGEYQCFMFINEDIIGKA